MSMTKRYGTPVHVAFVIACLALFSASSSAQFKEDALRLALPGIGAGARALGLGDAYTGVANDYSALFWNPAGLAQIQNTEASFGLSHVNGSNQGTLFSNQRSYSNNSTNVNTAGFAYPVPVRRGNFVIAFGFSRQANFSSGLQFSGFNPSSSIIQYYSPDGQFYPSDFTLPEFLALAAADTVTGRFVSPITGNLTQSGTVTESGGLNNWSAAAAADVTQDISLGVTLTGISGSYRYDRAYREQDLAGHYTNFSVPVDGVNQLFDISEVDINDFIEGDISGFNAKFGFMYRVPDRFRLGLAIKTPTWYHVTENYGTSATSFFHNGDVLPADGPYQTTGSDEYDVHTPWVFSAGASVMLQDLMLTGSVDLTDWTQLEFANATPVVMEENQIIKTAFTTTADLGAGAEYTLPGPGLRLRAGYMFRPSPYKNDPSSYDRNYVTGGLGIPLGGSTMLDLAYAHGWWKTEVLNYAGGSTTLEKIATNNILMTFAFRF